MTSRRDARRTAIDILYQADLTDRPAEEVVRGWAEAGHDIVPFTLELVEGVTEREPDVDLLLEEHAEGWTVARMAALDRTILRLAVFELTYRTTCRIPWRSARRWRRPRSCLRTSLAGS